MIDIIKQTPYEYSNQSRDYQVIARLYTALFNLSKMYIDDLSIWNNNIDNKLTTLRSKTLNFERDHQWDEDDLEAVTSCFKYLIMHKGTTKVLEYCINILMKVEHLSNYNIENPVIINNNNVTIRVPENLLTLGIIEDLVKYLLPIGLTYNIVKYRVSRSGKGQLLTNLYYRDGKLVYYNYPYGDTMVISTSDPGEEIIESDWTIIKDTDKVWLGVVNNELAYVPDNLDGIEHSTGVTLYDSEGNEIIVNNNVVNEAAIDIKSSGREGKKNYITNTFIYTDEQFEGE